MAGTTPTMLRRLRAEFVAITMALVGVVLGISFFTSYASFHNTQMNQTSESLQRVLEDSRAPRFGRDAWREVFPDDEDEGYLESEPEEDSQNQGLADAAVIKAFITSSGKIIDFNEAYEEAIVTTDVEYIVGKIVSEPDSEGSFDEMHIAWAKKPIEGIGTVVVFTDTTQRDEALKSQAFTSVLIFVAAMFAFFAASWWLSSWALKPVEDAWGRQRRFIADASHELKTPLTVILANSQILQSDPGIPDSSMRWVNSTSDEASRMSELVTELLELTRADEASQAGTSNVMATTCIDFSELVESMTLEFDAVAFERGCSIETAIEPGIQIMGDRSWLERAVKALIDNATKYADNGSQVLVGLKREGKHVVYSVNNKGTVISPEDLDHIFDRFYRSDRARSREDTGGFGLGLAIAKSIFEAHGGTITATSNATEGTTFTVTL